ncbi:FGGY-family carbohydrate kinase [Paraburkholderia dipogonis]|uniref:FGGY-family carbohydrate kinase n=1 Tax=Paraburkholderia dipogonis TaxID=1211383 RepID=A0ABW9B6J3_9BURK
MTQAQVPAIVEGCRATGVVLASVATELGLPPNVLVAAGGGDTATSALGVGATEPGEGFLSLGTSGVLSVVTERFRPSPELGLHALCHALPDRWHRTSVVLSAASCLRWLCKLTSVDEDCLLAEAENISESARHKAPLFLPYLSGERTPHNDPYAQGVFCGLSHSTDRGTLAYSAIEGVAFALSDGLSALRADGTRDTSIRLIGGGARSAFWAQLLADALGIVLHRPFETSYIAARLGCVAGGGDLTSVIRPRLRPQEFFPQDDRRQILSERLASYRSLYGDMRWLFPR